MDNLYYVLITQSIIIFSIVLAVIFLIIKLMRRSKFTRKDALIILLLVACTYLYLPFHLYRLGLRNSYTENYQKAISYYNKALKLSVIPYEKKMLKFDLGSLYYFYDKNGPKAIEYLESSLNGDYSSPYLLPHLYFLKGNYEKVRETENASEKSDHYYTALSDIMTDNYEEALDLLQKQEHLTYTDNMLISAIYNQKGMKKEADEYINKSMDTFNQILFSDDIAKQNKYDELMEHSTIAKFKEYVKNKKSEYGFVD